MHNFEEYFTDENIIKSLCLLRLKKAKVVHERRFYRKLVYSSPERQNTSLHEMFPPRRAWNRYRPRKKHRDRSTNIDMETLMRAIKNEMLLSSPKPWLKKLLLKCTEIRGFALSEAEYVFNPPRISHQHKSGNDYRAIASFDSVNDKLMDILNAKYLREQLDCTLEKCSVAFRSKADRPLNRNSAISDILDHRAEGRIGTLYVAECDIKGFFDCVSHSQAKRALKRSIEICRIRHPSVSIDARSIKIFESYLKAYSFSGSVKTKECDLRTVTGNPQAVYKWPLKHTIKGPYSLAHFHKVAKRKKIGVPQGGAHSCLIANIMLDVADKESLLSLSSSRGKSTYLRYCDDIILICESEKACNDAFNAYLKALEFLELPYHQPEDIRVHGSDFFNKSKTKSPYKWEKNSFPWVQFLGYQIRYDRLLRVRPSSIEKHKQKICTLREKITDQINSKPAKVSARRVLHRFNSKVTAFSVGRVDLHSIEGGSLPMCWCSGFSLLHNNKFIKSQLKGLDHEISKQRRHLKNRLKKHKQGATSAQGNVDIISFFGKPFSHYAQFDSE